MDRRPARPSPAPLRAERPPSWRCFRPGGRSALRRIRERASDDQAGKAAAGAEIGPNPRLRRQLQKLQRIGDMAGPERRLGDGAIRLMRCCQSSRSATKRSSRSAVSRETGVSARPGRSAQVRRASGGGANSDAACGPRLCGIMPRCVGLSALRGADGPRAASMPPA